MNRFFHNELQDLRSNFILMGQRSIDILRLSIQCLLKNEMSLVDIVLTDDDVIDKLDVAIDSAVVKYFSLRAPVAQDVRLLTVAMRCSHSLERCGDEACSIVKRARRIAKGERLPDYYHLPRMADLAIEQLRGAMDSFVEENPEKARLIPKADKELDDLHRDNTEKLQAYIAANPHMTKAATELLFVSKSIERVGDHAADIAEDVYYLFKAQDIRHTPEVRRSSASDNT